MAGPKHAQQFSGVHKRQLFHWIGRDIDAKSRAKSLSADDVRNRYFEYLKDDLDHGLPVKCPAKPEELVWKTIRLKLDLPMACFTEWTLSESRPHSSRYGRMAFGFSKPWVIRHGGQPVSYFSCTQRGFFLRSALKLYDLLQKLNQTVTFPSGLVPGELDAAWEQARYLLHFAKPFASEKTKSKPKRREPRPAVKPAGVRLAPRPRPATRYFGPVLDFLEEREWRIVCHKSPCFVPDATGRFDSRMRFDLGSELFTLVLPDNEVVKMVWQDKCLRRRLLDAPVPVTILSFQDIGTF